MIQKMVIFICRAADCRGALPSSKTIALMALAESTASPEVACDRQNDLNTRVFSPAYLL